MAAVIRLRYIGPHDQVVIPGVPDPIRHGAEFDCGGVLAEGLLAQATNYERVTKGA
jgi:hypothetical protein